MMDPTRFEVTSLLFHTMLAEETTSKVHVNPAEARRFVEGVLTGNGVPKDSAQIIARCLIEADIRGVDTHGESTDSWCSPSDESRGEPLAELHEEDP